MIQLLLNLDDDYSKEVPGRNSVQLFINGAAIGGEPVSADGEAAVVIDIQAAPWVQVDTARLIRNGAIVEEFAVALEDGRARIEKTYPIDEDGWYVVEVSGRASMFPVVTPVEIPAVLLTDAVGALAGAFGFGASGLGGLGPEEVHITTAYAITNPVWVDAQGDGYTQPAPPAKVCEGLVVVDVVQPDGAQKAAHAPQKDAPDKTRALLRRNMVPSMWFPRERNNTHDIRILFDQFSHGHGHGH